MFHGGTSFGLNNGANFADPIYMPQPTSYDYDSPLDEAGDPTEKYFKIRETIGSYLPLPSGHLPKRKSKLAIGPLHPSVIINFSQLLKHQGLQRLVSFQPRSFESLKVRNGFVFYCTKINFKPTSPAVLSVEEIKDRGYVFVDMVRRILTF